ncbi:MAG: class IV adenylate cyclase [Rhodothermales bacterium]
MINIEIKARCSDPANIRLVLEEKRAEFLGEDFQRDTYFHVANGRLKLREGNIENALIFYRRPNEKGPKRSDVILYNPEPGTSMKSILVQALGVDVIVEKKRRIYFIENVKFHIDDVVGLGRFVEIEAIDRDGRIAPDHLRSQCAEYLELFGIEDKDLISESYSDLLRRAKRGEVPA